MGKNLKRFLISGASSQIGLELVKKLLSNNYEVVGLYNKNKKRLELLEKKYKNLKIHKINFEDDSICKFKFDKIDCFISLQGYLKNSKNSKINEDDLIKHIKINYIKNLIIIEKIIPHMKRKKYGKIFLTSSVGTKFGGGEKTLYYSISKYLNEYHPSYLRKLIKDNISLNTISIGLVDTNIHKKINSKDIVKRIKLTPAKRIMNVNEISKSIYDLVVTDTNIMSNHLINLTNGE